MSSSWAAALSASMPNTASFSGATTAVANPTANIPTPLIHDDYVFCSTGYGTGAALLELKPVEGGVQADEVYFLKAKELQNHHGGMVMLGDYVYLGHGHNNANRPAWSGRPARSSGARLTGQGPAPAT